MLRLLKQVAVVVVVVVHAVGPLQFANPGIFLPIVMVVVDAILPTSSCGCRE